MKTYTLPVIGIMTLGAAAFANTTPSKASTGDVLLARDSFSTCQWLGDRFKWFNAERDHKNPYIQGIQRLPAHAVRHGLDRPERRRPRDG